MFCMVFRTWFYRRYTESLEGKEVFILCDIFDIVLMIDLY